MDFILPMIGSILMAPIVGLGCAIVAVLFLCLFHAIKKSARPKNIWQGAISVFVVCTAAAPLTLFLAWAFTLDAIMDAGNKEAASTSSEFWQSFAAIEHDLHDIKSENDPAYQKLKLLLSKYVLASTAVVGARHGNVRELSFQELDSNTSAGYPYRRGQIEPVALTNCVKKGQFDNWLIGTGFDKPLRWDSVATHLYSEPKRYLAKDVQFSAKRDDKRISVDVYTDIDIKPAYDNAPPVTEFLKRNLGGQFFYLVLGDVRFHPLSEKDDSKVQPIDKIHQAFLNLLTPSELESLQANVTDYMCVQSLSSKDCHLYAKFNNPHLKSTVLEEPSRYH